MPPKFLLIARKIKSHLIFSYFLFKVLDKHALM